MTSSNKVQSIAKGLDAAKNALIPGTLKFDIVKDFGPFDAEAHERCRDLLAPLKTQITALPSCAPILPPHTTADPAELSIARDVMEFSVYIACRQSNLSAFEREIAMLYPFYNNYSSMMPPSPNQRAIEAMYLLYLIAQDRLTDCHVALERIPLQLRDSDPFLSFVVELRRVLTEGNYTKILSSANNPPCKLFEVFINRLVDAIRESNARAMEVAYLTYTIPSACTRLMFAGKDELQKFATARNQRRLDEQRDRAAAAELASTATKGTADLSAGLGLTGVQEEVEVQWQLVGDALNFVKVNKEAAKRVDPPVMMERLIGYAVELERIV